MGSDGAGSHNGLEQAAAATLDAAALESARFGFHRNHGQRSAKRVLHFTQVVAFALIIAGLWWAASSALGTTLFALHVAALLLFTTAIAWRLVAASILTPILSRLAAPQHWPTYTILCPLYGEAAGVAELVAAINRLDYPAEALDVKLLVESDDADTVAAAQRVSKPAHIAVLIVPAAAPRTKPKALNVGLSVARGEYVAVYDAEDRPHPQQLRAALAAFEDGDAQLACVQAPLVVDNADDAWIARQFAAEYAIQFGEILPLLAKLRLPLPLGGSSNHFRTEILRGIGGWDPNNVTEDADLGYRLARDGYHSGVIAPPTWEEAPITFRAWRRQRARWIKGHIQTWLVLMRDPLRTMREMGLPPFASMQLILGGGVVAAFAHGPIAFVILAALLSPDRLLESVDFVVALSGYTVAVFASLSASALSRNWSHLRAALTMPFYWPLSTVSACAAFFDILVRPHHWSKTAHGVSRRRGYSVRTPAKRHVWAPTLALRGRA
ncbi:MAG: glycosyltransferase [Proteobacteria bacterium]|nr:glycosyltransferase [Pseudomonadota bacterium]